jgi:hypothetical protein
MRRDIADPLRKTCSSHEQFRDEVHHIKHHLVPREAAQKWAKQLRFIAMDEVDALRDGELTEETRESSNAYGRIRSLKNQYQDSL